MDETWEVDKDSTLLQVLNRVVEAGPVEFTRNGKVVGTFLPNDDTFDEADAIGAMENILAMDPSTHPQSNLRIKDMIHYGHRY